MLRRSDPRPAALLLAGALLLTGCSGVGTLKEPIPTPTHVDLTQWDPESGNGIALLGGQSARAVVLAAVRRADAVTMTGSFTDAAGRELAVRVTAARSDAAAELTIDGQTEHVVVVDGRTYLKPSARTAAERELDPGAYACPASDDLLLASWNGLVHPLQTLADYTRDAAGLGQPVDGTVEIILGAEATQGSLVVRTDGRPLPVSLLRADAAGTLRLEFGGWDEHPDIAVPEPLAAGC